MRLPTIFPLIVAFLCSVPVYGTTDHELEMPGGVTSHEQPATQEIQDLVRGLHHKIKAHLLGVPGGRNIVGQFTPITYRSQLVNGVNYFVKVSALTGRKTVYYHLKFYKPFNGPAQLTKVEGPKRLDDSITYF